MQFKDVAQLSMAFKREHGHLRIDPRKYSGIVGTVGHWLKRKKGEGKNKLKGKKADITEQELEFLQNSGVLP
jgi:hypothetical protein